MKNIPSFSADRVNELVNILFEKNIFDSSYILPSLSQIDLLDEKYRDKILTISIDFIEDNFIGDNIGIVVQILQQNKYLNSTQQNKLYDNINKYLSVSDQLSIDSIVELLEALPYEEFKALNIGNVDGIVLGEGVGHIGLDVSGEVVVTVR